MMSKLFATAVVLLAAIASATDSPFTGCSGTAKYKVTFFNFLTSSNFGSLIPESGLVFSPLAAVSHSGRISFFTVRGFANRQTEFIAEQGNNAPFLRLARRFKRRGLGVKTFVGADGPTMPGKSTSMMLEVDCSMSFVTVLGMIAPSPDWIVQINNVNLFDTKAKRFISFRKGSLIAYDSGVDDGREFTPPGDLSLDLPTKPQKNIAPLVEDETDRFEGRVVGVYKIQKM